MPNPKLVPTAPKVRAEARALYMEHVSINEIAHRLKLTTAAIARWRTDERWNELRLQADEELAADLTSARRTSMTRILKSATSEVERTIRWIQERPDPMSVAEATKMGELIRNLHGVARLDENKSTENHSVHVTHTKKLTVDEIRAAIAADPFFAASEDPINKE